MIVRFLSILKKKKKEEEKGGGRGKRNMNEIGNTSWTSYILTPNCLFCDKKKETLESE